jgi:PAS domain S-box-containing protein
MVVVVAGLGWTTRPEAAFLLVTAVLLSLLPAVYAWWRTTTRRIRPGPVLLLGQSLADLTLVAVLSNYAGPDQPAVVALFVLLIAIYALLLPLIPGGVMVSGGIAAYSISVTQAPGIEVDAAFWGQIVVFLAVYATVAYLGRLLQAAEAGQSALETELLRVRLEAEDILQNISAGILTVDGTGRLGFINPTAEDLLGLDGQGLLGGPVLETLRERSPELHAAIEVGIGEGRRLSRAVGIVTHPDGRRFPIGLSTTTFSRPDQQLPAVTAIFSDISDLERLKGLHQRAERLEAVAELSASLAHEIRNPLASIRSSVEQLARSAQADADDRFLGKLIVRESDRLSRLLTEFLDFSRVRVARFESVDLHGLALEAAEVVRGHPDCVDRIVIAVRGAPAPLQGDSDLLHRVAVNLILNGVQAVAGAGTRGRVEVTVDRPDPEGLPLGRDFVDPVRLRVTDDGPGIDPEMKDRLFAPFASGRPGGTGLGLAIVQRAVEAHRGLVFVDSVPGSGTTFTIYLHTRRPSQEIA